MRPSRPDAGRVPPAAAPLSRRIPVDLVARAAARAAVLIPVAALVLTSVSPAGARESDLSQPIDVSADRSEYDQRAGTQTLIGNVEIRQGTMLITADRVAISLENAKLARIEGTGSPIRFEQENDDGETVEGEAGAIDYNATDGTLVLSGGATFTQPGQSLSSERIAVDARTQKVSAEGGSGSDGEKGRVSIRLDAPPGNEGR